MNFQKCIVDSEAVDCLLNSKKCRKFKLIAEEEY